MTLNIFRFFSDRHMYYHERNYYFSHNTELEKRAFLVVYIQRPAKCFCPIDEKYVRTGAMSMLSAIVLIVEVKTWFNESISNSNYKTSPLQAIDEMKGMGFLKLKCILLGVWNDSAAPHWRGCLLYSNTSRWSQKVAIGRIDKSSRRCNALREHQARSYTLKTCAPVNVKLEEVSLGKRPFNRIKFIISMIFVKALPLLLIVKSEDSLIGLKLECLKISELNWFKSPTLQLKLSPIIIGMLGNLLINEDNIKFKLSKNSIMSASGGL